MVDLKLRANRTSLKFANLVLRGLCILCVSALAYTLIHYRQYYVGEPLNALIKHSLPGILALALLASEWLNGELRVNLALTLVSLGTALYVAESLVLFVDPAGRRLPSDFDRRTRLEVIKDLREQGVDAVPAHLPRLSLLKDKGGQRRSRFEVDGLEFMPVSGMSRKTSVNCNEDGRFMIFMSDEHGFNNPSGVWSLPKISIVTIGDSFTQGDCVRGDENYVARIRRLYPATLNLGSSANGPLLELATLKEYVPALKPEVVIWCFFENDITDLQREKASDLMMRYVRGTFTQNLAARQADIDRVIAKYIDQRERELVAETPTTRDKIRGFLMVRGLRASVQRWSTSDEPERIEISEADYALFEEILVNAKEIVRSWSGRLHFVYLPHSRRFQSNARDFAHVHQMRERALQIARNQSLSITDLTPVFEDQKNPRALFSVTGYHYSAEGYRLVAEAVLADIGPMLPAASHGGRRPN
jgi:GDSL-like Lipase/Acylhydrolase family